MAKIKREFTWTKKKLQEAGYLLEGYWIEENQKRHPDKERMRILHRMLRVFHVPPEE
jgi:hypothetical protein